MSSIKGQNLTQTFVLEIQKHFIKKYLPILARAAAEAVNAGGIEDKDLDETADVFNTVFDKIMSGDLVVTKKGNTKKIQKKKVSENDNKQNWFDYIYDKIMNDELVIKKKNKKSDVDEDKLDFDLPKEEWIEYAYEKFMSGDLVINKKKSSKKKKNSDKKETKEKKKKAPVPKQLWVDFEESKQMREEGKMYCSYVADKGKNKGKFCGTILTEEHKNCGNFDDEGNWEPHKPEDELNSVENDFRNMRCKKCWTKGKNNNYRKIGSYDKMYKDLENPIDEDEENNENDENTDVEYNTENEESENDENTDDEN